MRSFLTAKGHVSAGRLAKPVCSGSSSCLSSAVQKDSFSENPVLSEDLVHALERQGRNSFDATNSAALNSSLAPSRLSMETVHGTAIVAHTQELLQSAMWPLPGMLRTSFGSRVGSAMMSTDSNHVAAVADACAPANSRRVRPWGSDACAASQSSSCNMLPMHGRPGATPQPCDVVAEQPAEAEPPCDGRTAHRRHTPHPAHRDHVQKQPLHRVLHSHRPAHAAAPPPAPGVAVAMSSMLFRPAAAPAVTAPPAPTPCASWQSATTAADTPPPGASRDGNSMDSLLSAGSCTSAGLPEDEGRPSTDSAFQADLLTRVARARQTMDFAARQRATFGSLTIAELPLWDALRLLDSLPPVPGENAALSPLRHALLCAQWCAHEMSQFDWAPLVGLMHSLGRLLSHERFGAQPEWAVTSESYPLGCRFSDAITGHVFLSACPDRRCSAYASPFGIYAPHCGFDAMHFTWTAAEYLSLVVSGSGARLPFAAKFVLRYQAFESAITDGEYGGLASAADEACLSTLRKFAAIRRAAAAGLLEEPPGGPSVEEVAERCSRLFDHYFPAGMLRF